MKLLGALVIAMTTCNPAQSPETPEALVRARDEPLALISTASDQPISEASLLADLASARVIYLGERHSRATDHAMQHRILSELYGRDPALAVGFEMFQAPFQNVLSEWRVGHIDEVALRRETEWDSRWGFDFALYRPILEFVRARHMLAFALNARAEITRAVGRGGLEGLSESDRESLPTLALDNSAHRALIEAALIGDEQDDNPHGPLDDATLDRLYTAQVIWDATMAANIDKALMGEISRIVVLAGVLHVQSGLGIPSRTHQQSQRTVIAIDEHKLAEAREASPPLADYLWVVDPTTEIE